MKRRALKVVMVWIERMPGRRIRISPPAAKRASHTDLGETPDFTTSRVFCAVASESAERRAARRSLVAEESRRPWVQPGESPETIFRLNFHGRSASWSDFAGFSPV